MSKRKQISATTHVDSHGYRMTKEALLGMVEQTNKQYIRVTIEHDPRKPPVGRIFDARLIELNDGHFAVESEFEYFDGIDPVDDSDEKEIAITEFDTPDRFIVQYDQSYDKPEYQQQLSRFAKSLDKPAKLTFFVKKSIEPLSILTIGGIFVIGKIFEGFLNKASEEIYDSLKDKLIEILELQKNKPERVLEFALNVKKADKIFAVHIFLTNPRKEDISTVLEMGFKKLDIELGKYLSGDIKEVVLNYNDRKFEVSYWLNGKGKVYVPSDEFKIIDIYA